MSSKSGRPKDRASSLQPQRTSREASRVKDFPAGNVTTSASRVAFLRSLCRSEKFGELIELVQAVVCATLSGDVSYLIL